MTQSWIHEIRDIRKRWGLLGKMKRVCSTSNPGDVVEIVNEGERSGGFGVGRKKVGEEVLHRL